MGDLWVVGLNAVVFGWSQVVIQQIRSYVYIGSYAEMSVGMYLSAQTASNEWEKHLEWSLVWYVDSSCLNITNEYSWRRTTLHIVRFVGSCPR